MDFYKKDGKVYLKLLDGDLEINEKQISDVTKGVIKMLHVNYKPLLTHIELFGDTYSHNKWNIAEVPVNADVFIKFKLFFHNIQRIIEQDFKNESDQNESLNKHVLLATLCISELQLDLANPYSNHELINYEIKGWENIKIFIEAYRTTIKTIQPAAGFSPIPLKKDVKVNQLTTILSGLIDKKIVDTSKANFKRMVLEVFVDSDNKAFKESTIDTYFNESKKSFTQSKK